jgi:hypothetical protein
MFKWAHRKKEFTRELRGNLLEMVHLEDSDEGPQENAFS